MNVVVLIDGREAVPVRAIPLLTNWETMSPDLVARALSWDEDAIWFEGLQAFRVDEGQRAVPATWWENVARRKLKALSDSIKAAELTHETGLQEWRRGALEILPAGVYVWKDQFEPMHCMRYGPDGTKLLRNGAAVTEVEHERLVTLDFEPFVPDADIQRLVMEGFVSSNVTKDRSEMAFVLAFYKTGANQLNIEHWAGLLEVTPQKAAKVLCGEDPLGSHSYADSSEVKMLTRIFEDRSKNQPGRRTLRDWVRVAEETEATHRQEISKAVLDLATTTVATFLPTSLVTEQESGLPVSGVATPVSVSGSYTKAPLQRSAAQDAAILAAIREAGCDPLALPVNETGKSGVKAKVRRAIANNTMFVGTTVFDKAWERLRRQGDIADRV
jgi:hypothetical protein